MADTYDYTPPALDLDDDMTPLQRLGQILQPAPPIAPAVSGPGQSTPQTGNLAVTPQQAQPRVSGPAMLPGIATKPENLQPANTTIASQAPLLRVPGAGNGLRSGSTPIAIRDSSGNPVRSYADLMGGANSRWALAPFPAIGRVTQSSPGTPVPTAVAPSQPQELHHSSDGTVSSAIRAADSLGLSLRNSKPMRRVPSSARRQPCPQAWRRFLDIAKQYAIFARDGKHRCAGGAAEACAGSGQARLLPADRQRYSTRSRDHGARSRARRGYCGNRSRSRTSRG